MLLHWPAGCCLLECVRLCRYDRETKPKRIKRRTVAVIHFPAFLTIWVQVLSKYGLAQVLPAIWIIHLACFIFPIIASMLITSSGLILNVSTLAVHTSIVENVIIICRVLKQQWAEVCVCAWPLPSWSLQSPNNVKDSLSYFSFLLSLIIFHLFFTPVFLSLFRQVSCDGFNQLELI